MGKKDRELIARRAWNLLRLALLWTRKGGVFKRRLMMELRVVPKFLKSLGHNTTPRGEISYYYRERELSFDKTPIFHVKMCKPTSTRFNIPCITTPQVDFDYDEFDGVSEDQDKGYNYDGGRKSFLMMSLDDEEEVFEDRIPAEEDGIDIKAEEFIAKFYDQMKLQRQISYLQYCQKINKGTT